MPFRVVRADNRFILRSKREERERERFGGYHFVSGLPRETSWALQIMLHAETVHFLYLLQTSVKTYNVLLRETNSENETSYTNHNHMQHVSTTIHLQKCCFENVPLVSSDEQSKTYYWHLHSLLVCMTCIDDIKCSYIHEEVQSV